MKRVFVCLLIVIFVFTASPCVILAYQAPAQTGQDDAMKQMLEDMPQDEPAAAPTALKVQPRPTAVVPKMAPTRIATQVPKRQAAQAQIDDLPPIPDTESGQAPVVPASPGKFNQPNPVTRTPVNYMQRNTGATQLDVCANARKDAEKDSGGMFWLWAGIGCTASLLLTPVLGLVAVICGYAVSMPVPANRIIGKSSEYVNAYTTCYQEQTRGSDGTGALIGCLLPCVAYIVIYAIFFTSFFAAANASTPVY